MKIKTAIRLIEYSKVSIIMAFIGVALIFTERTFDTKFYLIEALLCGAALALFLFRILIVSWSLKHSDEPALLYAVLQKLDLNCLTPSAIAPNNEYKPSYPTPEFLANYHLNPEIRSRRALILSLFRQTRDRIRQANAEPSVRFTNDGLRLYQQQISWKSIYNWQYESSGRDESEKIIINYYDRTQFTRTTRVDLNELNTNKVDFLLLLTHYKSQYGA